MDIHCLLHMFQPILLEMMLIPMVLILWSSNPWIQHNYVNLFCLSNVILQRHSVEEEYHQQYLKKGGQSAKKKETETIRCYG